MPLKDFELSPKQLSELKKLKKGPWLDKEQLIEWRKKSIDKIIKSSELTDEQIVTINEIREKNLRVESNIENEWIIWMMISFDLEDNGEEFKMFIPDDKHLRRKDINGNSDKLKEYLERKWINKEAVPTAIRYLLMDLYFYGRFDEKDDKRQKSNIFNIIDKEWWKFKKNDGNWDNANLILKWVE